MFIVAENTISMLNIKQRTYDFFPNIFISRGLNMTNMTRIDVGLARSYVKLLLSSWKTYMCNLMAWYINK